MDRTGAGYAYEMLIAIFILILAITFYAEDMRAVMPPMLMMVGGLMVLGGMIAREPLIMAGGVMVFAIALIYSEVVLI